MWEYINERKHWLVCVPMVRQLTLERGVSLWLMVNPAEVRDNATPDDNLVDDHDFYK